MLANEFQAKNSKDKSNGHASQFINDDSHFLKSVQNEKLSFNGQEMLNKTKDFIQDEREVLEGMARKGEKTITGIMTKHPFYSLLAPLAIGFLAGLSWSFSKRK